MRRGRSINGGSTAEPLSYHLAEKSKEPATRTITGALLCEDGEIWGPKSSVKKSLNIASIYKAQLYYERTREYPTSVAMRRMSHFALLRNNSSGNLRVAGTFSQGLSRSARKWPYDPKIFTKGNCSAPHE